MAKGDILAQINNKKCRKHDVGKLEEENTVVRNIIDREKTNITEYVTKVEREQKYLM